MNTGFLLKKGNFTITIKDVCHNTLWDIKDINTDYKVISLCVSFLHYHNTAAFNSFSDAICVSKLTITGSDNGLSPDRRQAIIWTNAGILLIGPLGKNFIEILIEIYIFSFKKMHLKLSTANMAAILSKGRV